MDTALAQSSPAVAEAAVGSASSAIGMIGSLVIVLLVIFALAYLVRRLQSTPLARGALMRVHGGIQLGTKERVVILEAGGQQFLVGVASGSVNLLHTFEQPVVQASAPQTVAPAFAEKLNQLLRREPRS
ncbi:flagellar biosynthetic protein FliO [Sinimarinibacterium sp. CAU 1509]|uniref:flagellar biosynthetic protein FliO n=1 Tax=Sinimarinibacterium sp. CAU 1509 TaxID=2562283 RepID=UPI0010AD41A0|nr:flagellar biosynthetic protein FliO [Sinimarinibacterium sp. CAU 1509]TJY62846.1 flagellar biosynthetic protein FliO [Sinimarinibacterium sp. CAU 1509]